MQAQQGIIWLAVACLIVLLIAGWQKKKEIFKNFVIRLAIGVMMITALNIWFTETNVNITVGINPVSIAAIGTLGVPGVVMLYGIAGCKYL